MGRSSGISNNTGTSRHCRLATGADGNPVAVWGDDSGGDYEIYLRRWDGSSWVGLGGSEAGGGLSNNTRWSDWPDVVIGADNNPIAAWYDTQSDDYEIYLRRWDGSSWVELGGSASGGGVSNTPGRFSAVPRLDLMPNGDPVVVYSDEDPALADRDVYLRRWDGCSWVEMGAGSGTGQGISNNNSDSSAPDMAIDAYGRPVVAWHNEIGGDWQVYVRKYGAPQTAGCAVDLQAASDTGHLDNDNITSDNTPTYDVEVSADGTIRIDWGGDGTWDVVQAVGEGGVYQFTPAAPLADGVRPINVQFQDSPWRIATASCPTTIDTGNAAPGTPDLAAGSDSGVSGSDDITNDATPLLQGTGADPNAQVEVLVDGTGIGTTIADAVGNWSFEVGSDGYYNSAEWVKTVGGTRTEYLYGITTDGSGNVFYVGRFYDTVDFDPGAGVDNHTADSDGSVYITKINADGSYGWTRSFGGGTHEWAISVATDSSGAVYTSGRFDGTVDFDPGAGLDSRTSAGQSDVFLIKLNGDGSYAWTQTFGGTADDEARGVAVDSSGNVFVSGWFSGTVDFDPSGGGTDNRTSVGSADIFVSKFDSSGNYQWAYTVGGSGIDWGYRCAVDGSDNVFLTGWFADTVDFDPTAGTDERTSNGDGDNFIVKLDNSGNYAWTVAFGGSEHEQMYDVATTSSGGVLVVGAIQETVDFDPSGATALRTSNGGYDAFVAAYAGDGSFQWAWNYGSAEDDVAQAVGEDTSGNAFVVGTFRGTTDLNPGPGVDVHTARAEGNFHMSMFGSDGTYRCSNVFLATGPSEGRALACAPDGSIYMGGWFRDTVDMDPGYETDSRTANGDYPDAFLIKYTGASDALTDGAVDITAQQIDLAGNASGPSSALTVTVDTTPPGAPGAAPDLQAGSDTGPSNSDDITGDLTPTFDVAVGAPYVRLYRDGTRASDLYESMPATLIAQPLGTFDYTSCAVDTAGNVSGPSAALAVTFDRTLMTPLILNAANPILRYTDLDGDRIMLMYFGAGEAWVANADGGLPADGNDIGYIGFNGSTNTSMLLMQDLDPWGTPNTMVAGLVETMGGESMGMMQFINYFGNLQDTTIDIDANLSYLYGLAGLDNVQVDVGGTTTMALFTGAMDNCSVALDGGAAMLLSYKRVTDTTIATTAGGITTFYMMGGIAGASDVNIAGDVTTLFVMNGVGGTTTLAITGEVGSALLYGPYGGQSVGADATVKLGRLKWSMVTYGAVAGEIQFIDTAAGSNTVMIGDLLAGAELTVLGPTGMFGSITLIGRLDGAMAAPEAGVGNRLYVTQGGNGTITPADAFETVMGI